MSDEQVTEDADVTEDTTEDAEVVAESTEEPSEKSVDVPEPDEEDFPDNLKDREKVERFVRQRDEALIDMAKAKIVMRNLGIKDVKAELARVKGEAVVTKGKVYFSDDFQYEPAKSKTNQATNRGRAASNDDKPDGGWMSVR